MRVTLQLVISHDDGHEETVTDVLTGPAHMKVDTCGKPYLPTFLVWI